MTKKIIIVGAGLVGLFTALYASHAGYQVTVIEKGRVGGGAARGNAGEICPSLADPLPGPGMVRTGLLNSFRSDAALRIAIPPSVPLATWLARFALNCTSAKFERGLNHLNKLATRSFELYEEIDGREVPTEFSRRGNLRVFASVEAAENEYKQLRELRRLGLPVPEKMMSGNELRELAPMISEKVQSGFHLPGQWFVNPSRMVDDLAAKLRVLGVEIHEGVSATSVQESGTRSSVFTTHGEFAGDYVVVAAGAWSDRLFKTRLGLPVIVPGKGYSFSVHTERMPNHVVNFPQANAVATPMGNRLQITGTMEFDGSHEVFHPNRIQRIVRAVTPYLNGIDLSSRFDEWVGPRPMTVDGLPRIGKVRGSRGTFIAAGHNMLGLTLAPATAELILDEIEGRQLPEWSSAFAPKSFALGKAA